MTRQLSFDNCCTSKRSVTPTSIKRMVERSFVSRAMPFFSRIMYDAIRPSFEINVWVAKGSGGNSCPFEIVENNFPDNLIYGPFLCAS